MMTDHVTYPDRSIQRLVDLRSLGFSEEPFSNSADARFFFLSPEHGKILEGLQDLIELRRGLGVVIGSYGLGKTTLARRLFFLYDKRPGYIVTQTHSAAFQTEMEILNSVCNNLGVERRKSREDQYNELEMHMVRLTRDKLNVVVILDDAEHMTAKALTFVHRLYNFDISQKLVQVILFGQPELLKPFRARPEVLSRVSGKHIMNNLTVGETLQLVNFRCTVANRKEPFLTKEAVVPLWVASQGVPRSIVNICFEAIYELVAHKRFTADEEIIELAIQRWTKNTQLESNTEKETPKKKGKSKDDNDRIQELLLPFESFDSLQLEMEENRLSPHRDEDTE